MDALAEGGASAGEALISTIASHGYVLERLDTLPWIWSVQVSDTQVLELWFTGGDEPVVAALSYREGKPSDTAAQKRAAKLQQAFYARYEELCATATLEEDFGEPGDRMLFLIAEFEADVNNGGFEQYLENKGAERATETVSHLRTVRADRSADWLSSALGAGVDPPALEALDQQFYESPEDLASLVMGHLGNQP